MSVGGTDCALPLHFLIHHPWLQVDIIMGMDSGDLSDFVENVEWECHGMPATKNVIMYGCCSDPYPDITYTVLLQRRSSFYIFNLLLPCFLISFLAPLGFYLPADSGEKVSLGVTVLLALTVFQLMVAESMPPSESVPLIGESVWDVWMCESNMVIVVSSEIRLTTVLSVLSFFETFIQLFLHHLCTRCLWF